MSHLLQVDDLGFGYGADALFSGVAFSLSHGDRMALVAPNGAGKSTLLRIVHGELSPDRGRVVRRGGATVGYYRQSHEIDATAASTTVEQALGADDHLVDVLASHLGFKDLILKGEGRTVGSLSGGERSRVGLGAVLARAPDILLLDEPTNHLDIDTIAWLEDHLRTSHHSGALLVVSHDRRFLDRVTNHTAELGARTFRTYPVSYGRYVTMRADDLARERATVQRQQAFIQKTEDFIRKNIAGQKTKQAQSRRKMLDKLERQERPEDVWAESEKLRVRFPECPRSGDIVLDAKGLGAARGGRRLFDGLDLLVRRGDRIGVVGPNGSGKSTLLALLAGKSSGDEGTVRMGTNLAPGYFDQHLGTLDPTRTAVDEIRSVRGDFNVDVARQYLARFRITGDDSLRVIGGFSGGERSRLALAKLLLEPRNLLFLDEPTNHLDIPACEILEEALATGYEGTLIVVSHDRQFLETVTNRLIVVRDGRAEVRPGGFRDYARPGPVVRATRPAPRPLSRPVRRGPRTVEVAADTDDRREALELAIATAEAEIAAMRAELAADPGGDWAAIAQKAERERAASRKLESMLLEWTSLAGPAR
jgi:ATP-binding cassette, subfamily F, member 3